MIVLLLHILPAVLLAVVCNVIVPIRAVLSLDTDNDATSIQNTQQQQQQQHNQQQRQTKDKLSKDDYRVIGLEDVEPAYSTFDGSMYAGLLSTTESLYTTDDDTDETTNTDNNNNNNGQLMFWYFEPKQPIYNDTIVIWLNGGPGCSSLGGCLFEHCPVTIPLHPSGYYSMDGTDPFILLPNNYSWTKTTKMLYVEQPVGTGFSQTTNGKQYRIPQNETDVAIDFYNFLQNFYRLFTELRLNNDKLYIFGESYAGMYVPSIAHYIYEQNEMNTIHPYINIHGIGLGNGWIDVSIQGPSVIEYAHWHGMIDSNTANALQNEWYNCQIGQATTNGTTYNEFHEFTVPDECGIMSAVLNAAGANQVSWGSPNSYDIATWDKYFMLDDPNGKMATFYNNPLVQKALNVPVGTFWIECLPGAGRRRKRTRTRTRQQRRRLDDLPGKTLLAHDKPESVVPYIAELLDKANIQVLIYNGDRDMTTNAYGSEVVLDNMEWDGASGWSNNQLYQRGLWLPQHTDNNTTVGGYMKQYNNLQFLIVVQSGHLVPYNRPQVALELITRFLGKDSFIDKELPKYTIPKRFNEKFVATSTITKMPVLQHNNNYYDPQKQHTTLVNNTIRTINDDSTDKTESNENVKIIEASASDPRKYPFFYHHITTILIMISVAIVSFVFGLLLGNKQHKRREGYQYVANAATNTTI